ncbi:hypothetical protein [Pontibacter flavimaris]|uniref:hypothetical protein n=1 Tax=Pontibacter flavimaris TaxID=1797110 RepID=UPI00111529F2|nr:hypothetical protein [Pontibacter flavimaris]
MSGNFQETYALSLYFPPGSYPALYLSGYTFILRPYFRSSLAQASACAFLYLLLYLLYLLFRISLSGTLPVADFQVRVSHTFILEPYFPGRRFPQLETSYPY